ncbi:hypothetical protein MLD52_06985 [Puniceicoccaceae bacterium K14]|nr:hypothetical protein [Puniceicoccaceae bacterium K14]
MKNLIGSFLIVVFTFLGISSQANPMNVTADTVFFSVGDSEIQYFELLKYFQRERPQADAEEAARWLKKYLEKAAIVEERGYELEQRFYERCDWMSRIMLTRSAGPYFEKLYHAYHNENESSGNLFLGKQFVEWAGELGLKLESGLSESGYEELRSHMILDSCSIEIDSSLLVYALNELSSYDQVADWADFPVEDPEWSRPLCSWRAAGKSKVWTVEKILTSFFICPLVQPIKSIQNLEEQIRTWILLEIDSEDAYAVGVEKSIIYQRNKKGYYRQESYRQICKNLVASFPQASDHELISLYNENLDLFRTSESYQVEVVRSASQHSAFGAYNTFKTLNRHPDVELQGSQKLVLSKVVSTKLSNTKKPKGEDDQLLLEWLNWKHKEVFFSGKEAFVAARVVEKEGEHVIPFDEARKRLVELYQRRQFGRSYELLVQGVTDRVSVVSHYSNSATVEMLLEPKIEYPK